MPKYSLTDILYVGVVVHKHEPALTLLRNKFTLSVVKQRSTTTKLQLIS